MQLVTEGKQGFTVLGTATSESAQLKGPFPLRIQLVCSASSRSNSQVFNLMEIQR